MLNMNAIPIEMLDLVTYGTSAQVHAFDDATLMENVVAIADTVDTGRLLAAGRPLAVGPVGMTYPFNPWAVTTMPPRPDGMPYGYDRRQPRSLVLPGRSRRSAPWPGRALAPSRWAS